MAVIELYKSDNLDYTLHGDRILHPMSCTVTEKAGGSYELSMEHPLDELWQMIQPFAIIKVPIPVPQLDNATIGGDVTVWKVTASPTPVYAQPNAPHAVSYQAWVAGTSYAVGSKVTSSSKNYQLAVTLTGDERWSTPATLSKWTEIPTVVPGAAVLERLPQNTEIALLEDYSSSWVYIRTASGVKGYVLKSQAQYVRTETVTPVPPRTVKDQLFRIYKTTVDSKKRTIAVEARHVSYDLAGNLVGECNIVKQDPGVAISLLKSALMMDADCVIATNLDSTDGEYTGNLTNKTGAAAILDPDTGIAGFYNAMVVRDNWDFFIYRRDDNMFRGVTIRRGANLIGVTWRTDTSDIVTRIVPVAKAADGSDLYLAGIQWIDSPRVSDYPVIYMERLSVQGQVGKDDGEGGTYTETTLRAKMQSEALERLDTDRCDQPQVELVVDFTLLGDTAEYQQYKGLQKLYMYDLVYVVEPTIGLQLTMNVNEYVWDAIHERYTGIKLATVRRDRVATVSGYDVRNGAIDAAKLSAGVRTALGI